MKKLHLKNGMTVYVRLTEQPGLHRNHPDRIIAVYYDPAGELVYSVIQAASPLNHKVMFGEGIIGLAWYEVLQAAEIISNFEQYFNNLNQ